MKKYLFMMKSAMLISLVEYSTRIAIALIFCCLGISKAIAQEGEREYVPFVEEGKVWYCGYSHADETYPRTPEDPTGHGIDCIFTMRGDTLIGNKEYKKVYCQFEEYYMDKDLHYYCAVREDAYQVLIIEAEAKEEKLIYDFSLPGECIALPFDFNGYKFVRTGGSQRYGFLSGQLEYIVCKFMGNEVDYSNDPGTWINGVGNPLGNPFAFEFSQLIYDKPQLGKYVYVISCMKDDKYIFKREWLAAPAGPTSIDVRSHTTNSPKGSHFFDMHGRRVHGDPQKGLYIQNGKKILK